MALTGRPGLLQGGWAFDRKARPVSGRPGLLQGGQASCTEAGPLAQRPGLSQPLPPLYTYIVLKKIFVIGPSQISDFISKI